MFIIPPVIMSPLRTKGDDILFQSDFFFCFFFHFFRFFLFFCFFSAKLVQTITFLSFQIGQLYMVCGCMTIRRCVTYHNDLCGTLTFDLKVKNLFFKQYFLVRAITLRGDISFRYLKQFFLVYFGVIEIHTVIVPCRKFQSRKC